MTERIDHAAEAQKHIEWAHEQQGEEGQFEESVQHNATLAVAEATLALVEQQRIANLIALWNLSNASKFNLLTSAGVDPEAPDESASIILAGLALS